MEPFPTPADEQPGPSVLELVRPAKLLKVDIAEAIRDLSPAEVRFLVDSYYAIQDYRMQAANQARALTASAEPNRLTGWMFGQFEFLEKQVRAVLDAYSASKAVGRWARANVGIGPVLSSGLLAHIDISKAPTVGHIWSFAGLNPAAVWAKGEKRPWNARLKVLCWKIGQSMMKCSGRDDCLYGKLWRKRKDLEIARNEAGSFAGQAKAVLEKKKIGKDTEARKHYEAGHLPPGHIEARAERWAVKIFLAHWHEAAFVDAYHKLPPKPYVLEHVEGHSTEIVPQHLEEINGWAELRSQGRG